ncbi:Autophagy-related protein 3 [Niveomyces insectorum RCEF 264]|uniref:Ubiquitin-like-conjugating enzyme ATG10 n=1 Tax=Niveomyces insectorum RCEF 264 TaxID=1081102 RepID=A0A167RWK7_9HYPO|nr:Autophagy-related protein 3 [Niveomyces insectorum RCEF 264]
MAAPAPGIQGADFRDYPFLTPDEFAEVCHNFDRVYRQATLGPLRRRWRVTVCTAFATTMTAAAAAEYATYLQITRPLEETADPQRREADDLAGRLGRVSLGGEDAVDDDDAMGEAEEADEAALRPPLASRLPDVGAVTYEIHLHPTYRAPCLWFALHDLPAGESPFSLDTVMRRLVPPTYRDGLRATGAIGGISLDYHPVTGVPSFFVHPCLLGEAMANFDCTRQSYLMVWIGLVGASVGLWVPKEMALT